MAKKPDFSIEAMDVLGLTSEKNEMTLQTAMQNDLIEQAKERALKDGDMTLVQKSYYITKGQYKTLKVLAATSEEENEKDISSIIRTAIDEYLKRRM